MDNIAGYLDEGERILWERNPGTGKSGKTLRWVQVGGHIFLTIVSLSFTIYLPLTTSLKVVLGVVLVITTNAPLFVWSLRRLPEYDKGGDAIFFLTDQRVGWLRPDGELRQAPICPGLKVNIKPNVGLVEFSLGERTPVSFGGLSKEEILLVSSVTEGLIQKCESQ